MDATKHVCEVRPRKDHRGFDGAVIRVYDTAGNVIETHEHRGKFKVS
jgi:hypothetical protein